MASLPQMVRGCTKFARPPTVSGILTPSEGQ
jgi:hypothetical protein